jgi:transcriptional regulator
MTLWCGAAMTLYIPATNEERDPERLQAFIEGHPFATLVTPAADGLRVSHVPLLARRRGTELVLAGHLARANPHWRSLADGPSTAIFHGPHAYVSPTWYETAPAVPTWNYAVVHVTGPARLDDDPAAAEAHVAALTSRFEAGPGAWSPASVPEDFRRHLARAIVAFELRAQHVEGKLKLGQNRSAEDRRGVIAALERDGGDAGRELARMMGATLTSS